MAITLANVLKGTPSLPPRILIHGVAGIGKTTFGAKAPFPIFIRTEDGTDVIDYETKQPLDAPAFPLAQTFDDVVEALTALATDDHPYRTLTIDSLDWLEPLIWAHTCRVNGWTSIESPGYGKGYVEAMKYWSDFINALNYLRSERGMTVILLTHTQVKRYDDPANEPYDRYIIALHKQAAAKMMEWADVILFANYRIATTQSDTGFNNKKTRAIGGQQRLLFTEERASHIAKNRYALPAELPLSWAHFAATIPYYNNQAPAAAQPAAAA